MNVEIVDARPLEAVLKNLFPLYIHDLSQFTAFDVEVDGTFRAPPSFAAYWQAPERHPFLLRADGNIAGFALVRQMEGEPLTHDMGEFFVLARWRRHGVGRIAAHALFDRFKGLWEVRELVDNLPAQAFWHRIIGDYAHGVFEESREFFERYGREFIVQRFRSPDA
jgi:predicted acetyltransferase